jgi:hypothetical protein
LAMRRRSTTPLSRAPANGSSGINQR